MIKIVSIKALGGAVGKGTDFLKNNLLAVGAGIGGAVLGGGLVAASAAKSSVSKKRKTYSKSTVKRKRSVKRKTKRKLTARQRYVRKIKRRPGRQSAYTAGARKDRSTRRIRHTKNGQPYVILRSGKARFIKKSSAKRSRKRKGGRY